MLAACGAHDSRIVIAQQFTLVDRAGHVTAQLSNDAGSPHLQMFDAHHNRRIDVFLESNGAPDVYLFDGLGKARLGVDLCDSGAGNISYASPDGKRGITTYLAADGRYTVATMDLGKSAVNKESAALDIERGSAQIVARPHVNRPICGR